MNNYYYDKYKQKNMRTFYVNVKITYLKTT